MKIISLKEMVQQSHVCVPRVGTKHIDIGVSPFLSKSLATSEYFLYHTLQMSRIFAILKTSKTMHVWLWFFISPVVGCLIPDLCSGSFHQATKVGVFLVPQWFAPTSLVSTPFWNEFRLLKYEQCILANSVACLSACDERIYPNFDLYLSKLWLRHTKQHSTIWC